MTTKLRAPTMRSRNMASRSRWRWPVAIVVAAHGAIHLLGVWWTLDLGEIDELGGPTLLGSGQAPGEPAMILLGLLWLAAGLGFIAAGVAVASGWQKAAQLIRLAAGISLIPTVIWWNDAWIGAALSAVLLVLATRERPTPRVGPR